MYTLPVYVINKILVFLVFSFLLCIKCNKNVVESIVTLFIYLFVIIPINNCYMFSFKDKKYLPLIVRAMFRVSSVWSIYRKHGIPSDINAVVGCIKLWSLFKMITEQKWDNNTTRVRVYVQNDVVFNATISSFTKTRLGTIIEGTIRIVS